MNRVLTMSCRHLDSVSLDDESTISTPLDVSPMINEFYAPVTRATFVSRNSFRARHKAIE